MVFHVVTIFPKMIEAYLDYGIIGRAARTGIVDVRTHDLREFAVDRYGHIDDGIFGQGNGMLYRCEPLANTLDRILADSPGAKVVYLTPQGERFDNRMARSLSRESGLVLIAARYEGIDARIVRKYVDLEISVGDYVLTGGELPALTVIDAVSRFVEGSIKTGSADEDSFENGLLEYEHYTEPIEFGGMRVPEVLRGGNRAEIEEFRLRSSLRATWRNRPDLFRDYVLPLERSESQDPVKQLKRRNRSLSDHLERVRKITEEWRNGRGN